MVPSSPESFKVLGDQWFCWCQEQNPLILFCYDKIGNHRCNYGLSIENVIIKTENDRDVQKYVNSVRIDAKILDLPPSVKSARPLLQAT